MQMSSGSAVTKTFGLFEFLGMPLGLKNVPQTIQHTMNHHLNKFLFIRTYHDDTLVFSDSHEQHERQLGQFFEAANQTPDQLRQMPGYFPRGPLCRIFSQQQRLPPTTTADGCYHRFPETDQLIATQAVPWHGQLSPALHPTRRPMPGASP